MTKVCVLCGENSSEAFYSKFHPSPNFTSSNLLGAGNSLCARCEKFFSNQSYRRKSWIESKGKTVFYKRKEMLPFILDPPEPPFYIYIADSGKKQTFLKMFRKGPNQNQSSFWVCDEDLGLIHTHVGRTKEMVAFATAAFEALGKSKKPLLEGPEVKHWERRELCEKIEATRLDPLWQLIVKLL